MHRLTLPTLAVALAAVFATGCGGDSAPTRAEYTAEADAICTKANKQKQVRLENFLLENPAPPSGKGLSVKEEAKLATDFVTQGVLPSLRNAADELSELNTPSDGGTEANAVVEEFDNVVAELEDNPARLSLEPDPFEKVAEKARDYGFKVCLINY